jgi:DNA polymerase III psi subunit
MQNEAKGLATRWDVNVSVHQAEELSLETIRHLAQQQKTHTWRVTGYSEVTPSGAKAQTFPAVFRRG